jgi:hypothetical protein
MIESDVKSSETYSSELYGLAMFRAHYHRRRRRKKNLEEEEEEGHKIEEKNFEK